jgi:hypothetical protein
MTDDVVRTITIKGTTDGVDQATAAVNKLGDAMAGVTVTSDTTSKSTLSVQTALDRQQRSLDTTYRSQQQFNTSQKVINQAYSEGLINVDRHNQLMGLASTRFDNATASANPFAAAMTSVSGQLILMSAGAGPVGVFLAALGPWGIAAAVGVGLVSAAFAEAERTAHVLAEEAVNLEKFKETTGLSTDALQALTQAAAKHGVQADATMQAIVRFTTSWEAARQGSGAFLTQLQKIDPALASQIQSTKDVSVALDLYTQAIQKADAAGDIAARNQLMRAGGGRGGVAAFTGVAASVGDAGGMANLTQGARDADKVIGEQLLKQVAALQAELDATTKHADLMMGSIGAQPILETGIAWQKMREQVAGVLSDIANGTSTLSPWSQFLAKLSAYALGPATTGQLFGFQPGGGMSQPALNQMPAYPPQLDMTGMPGLDASKTTSAKLVVLKEEISLLGSAATANDKLALRLLELKAAVEGNATAENKLAAERGVSAAQLDAYTANITLHTAAMGAAASVTDVVNAKMAALAKQQQQGAGLTSDEVANVRRVAEAQANGTYAVMQATSATEVQTGALGRSVGAAETYRLEQTRLNEAMLSGKTYTDAETAAFNKQAEAAGGAKQAQAQLTAQQTANFSIQTSLMTGLESQIAAVQHQLHGNDWQAFMNDGLSATMRLADGMKQLSATAQTALSGMATDMRVGLQAGKTAWESFQTAAVNALNKISDKLMQMAIDSLWSKAFGGAGSSGLGGILGMFGLGGASSSLASSNAAATGAAASDLAFAFSSGGMVGIDGTPRYVHPAYFENAPRFDTGGMITDGGVPIIAHPGERVLNRQETSAYNSGGGTNIRMGDIHIDASGADPAVVVRLQTTLAQFRKNQYADTVKIVQDASSRGMRLHA